MTPGFATATGTARRRDRFPKLRDSGHFRRAPHVPGVDDLWLSSIGLGTYLGEPDAATDRAYTEAIAEAVRRGVNVLDTAINYRHQRSERNLGAALAQLIAAGEAQRDEIVVCTKAGFLSFDSEVPADLRGYFAREFLQPGIVDPAEIAGGMHCMAPRYLADQIERSRRNLGLETIDVFYVHNPESQLGKVAPEMFAQRLKAAFVMLEEAVQAGKIRFYGTATWNGYRVPAGETGHLDLEAIVNLARDAGGDQHHFRFVQAPFNLGMPEAYGYRNQKVGADTVPLLEAAQRLGVAVVASGTLHQGQLTEGLPEFVSRRLGMATDAENAIQFARSAPGIATALIGMSQKQHVVANLAVASHPLAGEEWKGLWRN